MNFIGAQFTTMHDASSQTYNRGISLKSIKFQYLELNLIVISFGRVNHNFVLGI